jgi:hypothetical protein
MGKVLIFKTPCQAEREQRDMAIYTEYNNLTSINGQSKTLVTQHLMKKFKIHTPSTVYAIRRRVEERLRKGGDI